MTSPGPCPPRRRAAGASPRRSPAAVPSATIACDVVVVRRDLDEHVGARREAEGADPPGVDLGPALQERHRAVDVVAPVPAEAVRRALAVAAPARVVEQHAVARGGQHPRVARRALAVAVAAVHEQDGRAVARRAGTSRSASGRRSSGTRPPGSRGPGLAPIGSRHLCTSIIAHRHRAEHEERAEQHDRHGEQRAATSAGGARG